MAGFARRKIDPFKAMLSVIALAGGTVAPLLPAADYYVSKSHVAAVDSPSSGSASQPYKTWNYAIAQVGTVASSASPKTLYVVPETYTSTSGMDVAKGVKVFGSGYNSKIIVAVTGNDGSGGWWYKLRETATLVRSDSVDSGNEISYLNFDGNNLQAYNGIYTMGRKNIKIHHCTFKDFAHNACTFNGQGADVDNGGLVDGAAPSAYDTGNEFTDNTVINCSDYPGYGRGALQLGAQDGFQCLRNFISNEGRSLVDSNGYCIKYYRTGYLKNCQFNFNTIVRAQTSASVFNIVCEFWECKGGNVFSYNTLSANIDIVNSTEGASTFSWDIHHNFIGGGKFNTLTYTPGITLECSLDHADNVTPSTCRKILIHHNYFSNLGSAVFFYPSEAGAVEYIDFYCNMLFQCEGFTVRLGGGTNRTSATRHVNWVGNTYAVNAYRINGYANQVSVDHQISDFNMIGNLIDGSTSAYILFWGAVSGGLVNGFVIDRCYISNCGNTNLIRYENAAASTQTTNLTETNMTKTTTPYPFVKTPNARWPYALDHKLTGHLAGVAHALLVTDCIDVIRGATPDIGAYEYV